MGAFFEVWLRGYAKDRLQHLAPSIESYHPHVTLVRPFDVPPNEWDVRERVAEYCRGKPPVPFVIEEEGAFGDETRFLHVRSDALQAFSDGLESALAGYVVFKEKLSPTQRLHVTLPGQAPVDRDTRIEQYMLRLTGIRTRQIWFSYDFVLGRELDREQSLDRALWRATVEGFSEETGLIPSATGFLRKQ